MAESSASVPPMPVARESSYDTPTASAPLPPAPETAATTPGAQQTPVADADLAPLAPSAVVPPGQRSRCRSRAELLARSFGLDAHVCPKCGGKLRLHAVVQDAASIRRILKNRGEPTEPPPISPARGPPSFQSRVLRRQADAPAERLDQERNLFHT